MQSAETREAAREKARKLAGEFAEKGNYLGWFDAFYREAAGDPDNISWGDLEPNPFFKTWAESNKLKGNGRKALVVGCGLGDDARYLDDLGFDVTAFDISPAAIEWARKLNDDIRFETANLFEPPGEWLRAFDFVLEVYTIQPLPLEMRELAIDAVASFVPPGGNLVVVARGREDDEEPLEMPWPVSRRDLSRFGENGLRENEFIEMEDDEGERRFVVVYERPSEQ